MASMAADQLEVLFSRDGAGRLRATRGPAPRAAPRLFLARSADENVWAFASGLDADLERELQQLCSAEPRLAAPSPAAAPLCRKRVLELLSPVAFEYRGPCFLLPDALPHDPRAREIEAHERFDYRDAFPWLAAEYEAIAPVAIAFESGQPAAICHSPRGLTDRAAEAGVETLARHRGRGLATAAVACWARAVQRSGRLALYSTAWENRASLRVAQRLAARIYGENWHVA